MKKVIMMAVATLALTAAATEPVDRFMPRDQRNVLAAFTVTGDNLKTVTGMVGTAAQRDSITRCLLSEYDGVTAVNTDSLRVLELEVPESQRLALVKLATATVRCEPKHSGEMATQLVMGMPVKVLEVNGDWLRVQMPDEYIAYVPESSVVYKSANEMARWRANHDRYIVTAMSSHIVTAPRGDEPVSDLVNGCIVEKIWQSGTWLNVATPDGRTGYVPLEDVTRLDDWAAQDFNAALIERTARKMMGAGYLWGGTTTKVTDCSGLVKVCYLANALILHRDASQQALTGTKIADWHDAVLGDLLFFGNSRTGRVTHVGIYLRDGLYIHCSGQVKINSLDESDPRYLYSPLSISRINGMIGTRGIIAARHHPWLF